PLKNGNESSFCVENLGILKNSEFFSGLVRYADRFLVVYATNGKCPATV
ncbi:hypothetical protein SAMN04487897_1721, partial [Paenibacillus sp. yr247]